MLARGEFHRTSLDDGVEVWVTQMGSMMNMNTAFINRATGTVALVDPYDAKGWLSGLLLKG